MPDQFSLRKAAILVASLDHRAADELLDRMPSAQAEAIRHTILSLHAIDEGEEKSVIREFLGPDSTEHTGTGESHDDVTLSLSQAEEEDVTATRGASSLQRLSDDQLTTLLHHERVATIAGVLARLPSNRCAAVIGRLDADKRPQVVRALARGVAASDAVFEEVWAEVAAQSEKRSEASSAGKQAVAHATSILQGIERVARGELLNQLAAADEVLARRLGWTGLGSSAKATSTGSPLAEAQTEKSPDAHGDDDMHPESSSQTAAIHADSAGLVETFDDLLLLDDATLAAALGAIEPQVAVLALTGPGEGVLNRLEKHLPANQVKGIRRRIRQQGPFVLADIQLAQQRLVNAARRLCPQDFHRQRHAA